MRRTMSAAEFCCYAHEQDLCHFYYNTCNQQLDDDVIGQDLYFHSVTSDPSVGLLSLCSEQAKMRIQNVQSVTVDSSYTVLGDYIVIHAKSAVTGQDRRFVLVAR